MLSLQASVCHPLQGYGSHSLHTLQGRQPILCMWWWWFWCMRWRPVKLCIMKFTPHRYSFGHWLHKFQSSCHSQRHSSKITMYLVTSCSLLTANKQSHIQVHTLNGDNFKARGSSETGVILYSWHTQLDKHSGHLETAAFFLD